MGTTPAGGYYPGSGYSGGYYGNYYTNRIFSMALTRAVTTGLCRVVTTGTGNYRTRTPYRPRHPQQGHDGQDGDHDGQGSGGQGSGGDGSGPGRPRQGGHLPVRDVEPGLAGTSPKAPYIRNPDIKRQQASPRQEGSPVAGKARDERPMRANQSQPETREVRNAREVREPREARSDTRDITSPIGRQLPSGVAKP